MFCKEFGFRHPKDLEASWSRACLYVMGEALYHANYIPPSNDGDTSGYDVDLISDMGIRVEKR